ncbi:MAG: type II secretion system GspH family protein [Opitutaceae bacterium]|jgi:prepilin-type N-terminal cleavage/methylation domain-containing protein|nr:type II secretion system GspH family protein [Opitutaceae bacterium]
MCSKSDSLPSRKTRGFTLLELLVVIAIIGILAGLLLPVLSHVRTLARTAEATSNIHQIHLGLVSYEHDHRRFPSLNETDPDDSSIKLYWNQLIMDQKERIRNSVDMRELRIRNRE